MTRLLGVPTILSFVISAGALLLAAQASEKRQVAFPTEIDVPTNNPYTGWGIWAGSYGFGNDEKAYAVAEVTTGFGDDAPLSSWVLLDWDWAGLEPQQGNYQWQDFDQVVRYWGSRGKQLVFRPWVTDNPGWAGRPGRQALPEWIWSKGVHYREYPGNGGTTVRELDYLHPTYQQVYLPLLRKLLEAFASRYDKPGTPIIMMQVMGYGHWADWGTWYSHCAFPSREFKHDLLATIMNMYIQTFKHIRLFEMVANDYDHYDETPEEQMYAKALDVAVANQFALIWTGFIDGLGGWGRDLKDRYWGQVPIIAEGNWAYEDMKNQKTHGTPDENLDVALDWHANFAHFYFDHYAYSRVVKEDRAFLARGLKPGGLGYRLVPVSLTWPGTLPTRNMFIVKQTWANRNVGQSYVQHHLRLNLIDAQNNRKLSEVDTGFDKTSRVAGETYDLTSVFHLPKV
jgi:hypothetical protein